MNQVWVEFIYKKINGKIGCYFYLDPMSYFMIVDLIFCNKNFIKKSKIKDFHKKIYFTCFICSQSLTDTFIVLRSNTLGTAPIAHLAFVYRLVA